MMRVFPLFLMTMLLPYTVAAQTVDKYIHVIHGSYDGEETYDWLYNLSYIKRIKIHSDKECSSGTINFIWEDGTEDEWEYNDVCDIREDFYKFLQDEDEPVFELRWVPLDRQ